MRNFFLFLLSSIVIIKVTAAPQSDVQDVADTTKVSRLIELENVVVYGSRSDYGIVSPQMSAVTIKKDYILSTPVFFGDPDILKTIQKFPGVQTAAEGGAGIFVRGGDYDQNYITIDGSPIYNAEHLQGYVSAINPDMVHSLNFYRGAFPARYGSRLSSVIDVGIKSGDFNSFHGLLSVGILSSRMQVEGPIWREHTSFNVAARVSYFNLIAKPVLKRFYDRPDALQPYSDMKYYDITAKIVHRFNERDRLSAVIYFGKDADSESPSESRSSNKVYTPDYQVSYYDDLFQASRNDKKWDNLLSSVYYTKFLKSNHRLNVNLSYSRYLYDVTYTNDFSHLMYNSNHSFYERLSNSRITTHSGIQDLSFTFDGLIEQMGAHDVRYGFKASRQWLNPTTKVYKDDMTRFLNGGRDDSNVMTTDNDYDEIHEFVDYKTGSTESINNFAIYAEDDFSAFKFMRINYGLRFSVYNIPEKTYLHLEPRISLRLMFSENLSAKLSYARMTQGVHRLSTNSIVQPGDMWAPITDKLPVMKSDILGVGLNGEWHGFKFSAEAYYKRLNNLLEYRDGTSYFMSEFDWHDIVARGQGKSYGLELMVERTVGNTTGWISYTWSKALRTFNRQGEEVNNGKTFYASTDRRNNLSATVTHKFKLSKSCLLELTGSWTYQTGRRGTIPNAIFYGSSLQEYMINRPISILGEPVMNYSNVLMLFLKGEIDVSSLYANFLGQPIEVYQSFREINDYKLPDTHHLDVNANLTVKWRCSESVIGFGIYNIYNRFNVSNVYIGHNGSKFVLKGVCPFPFMPSISFTQKF